MQAAYSFLVITIALSTSSLLAQAPAVPAPPQSTTLTNSSSQVTASPTDEDSNSGRSEVRIVRLSQVSGAVQMDRGTGTGFEAAFANLPVVQGAKLQTGNGTAEVELEDNSTLRLTPGTQIAFTKLDRSTTTGATNSSINVLKGTVYVSLEKTKGNTFTLTSTQGTATLLPGSQTRLIVDSTQPGLAVLTGDAQFQGSGNSTSTDIRKKKELLFPLAGQNTSSLVGDIEDAQYDGWYAQQQDFHNQYSKGSALSASPYLYGIADLNYYGNFADLPGCGRVWRPYFASAAWDPYANGIWTWYQNFGYSWVSPYPWGWAPFHYGAWQQCGAGLWGWAPGGAWSGLGNFGGSRGGFPIRHPGPGSGPIRHPYPVRPHPPTRGASFVLANAKPVTASGINPSTHAFEFRNDSAGLGIPREMFGKLNKASTNVEQHGSMAIPMLPVRTETARNFGPGDHNGAAGQGGAQEHRSYATEWRPATDANRHEASTPPASNGWSNSHPSTSNTGGGWSSASHASPGGSGSGGVSAASHPSGGGGGGGYSGGGGGGGASHPSSGGSSSASSSGAHH